VRTIEYVHRDVEPPAASSSSSAADDDNENDSAVSLYDKVLVDAECTHDGSLRHLLKMAHDDDDENERDNAISTTRDKRSTCNRKWSSYVSTYLNKDHVRHILELQHDLIRNGFRLLKPHGRMVYSTCSLSLKQNEDIVSQFLLETPTAVLVPIPTKSSGNQDVPCQVLVFDTIIVVYERYKIN
jgi:16S rRNA C967 or C1407 C5-methylase (RsmB/RsmF family)